MRNLVQPLPSTHCEHCDGELLFERLERDDPALDIEVQIVVCSKSGREHSRKLVGCATSETLVHRRVAEEQAADFRVPHSQAVKRVADRLGVHRTGGINSTSKGVAAVKTAMIS